MKSCPFCGSNNVGHAYRDSVSPSSMVCISCSECGASGPVFNYPSSPDTRFVSRYDAYAEEQWNNRAAATKPEIHTKN
jgi:Lar family restriction alleviation protein